MNNVPILHFYKLYPEAKEPKYGTKQSACFDISACLISGQSIEIFGTHKTRRMDGSAICINPNERTAIPTGLIFDIPEGYSVRLHPRSGLALKYGLTITNSEGVIDSDYVNEVKVIVTNTGSDPIMIHSGDRICQAELVRNLDYRIEECYTAPGQKSDRLGGFGSTGVSER